MTAQVIFLPGWRQVPHEEMVARWMIQEKFTLFHFEFEQNNRDLSEWQYHIQKEEVHHKIRQSMTLVKKPW